MDTDWKLNDEAEVDIPADFEQKAQNAMNSLNEISIIGYNQDVNIQSLSNGLQSLGNHKVTDLIDNSQDINYYDDNFQDYVGKQNLETNLINQKRVETQQSKRQMRSISNKQRPQSHIQNTKKKPNGNDNQRGFGNKSVYLCENKSTFQQNNSSQKVHEKSNLDQPSKLETTIQEASVSTYNNVSLVENFLNCRPDRNLLHRNCDSRNQLFTSHFNYNPHAQVNSNNNEIQKKGDTSDFLPDCQNQDYQSNPVTTVISSGCISQIATEATQPPERKFSNMRNRTDSFSVHSSVTPKNISICENAIYRTNKGNFLINKNNMTHASLQVNTKINPRKLHNIKYFKRRSPSKEELPRKYFGGFNPESQLRTYSANSNSRINTKIPSTTNARNLYSSSSKRCSSSKTNFNSNFSTNYPNTNGLAEDSGTSAALLLKEVYNQNIHNNQATEVQRSQSANNHSESLGGAPNSNIAIKSRDVSPTPNIVKNIELIGIQNSCFNNNNQNNFYEDFPKVLEEVVANSHTGFNTAIPHSNHSHGQVQLFSNNIYKANELVSASLANNINQGRNINNSRNHQYLFNTPNTQTQNFVAGAQNTSNNSNASTMAQQIKNSIILKNQQQHLQMNLNILNCLNNANSLFVSSKVSNSKSNNISSNPYGVQLQTTMINFLNDEEVYVQNDLAGSSTPLNSNDHRQSSIGSRLGQDMGNVDYIRLNNHPLNNRNISHSQQTGIKSQENTNEVAFLGAIINQQYTQLSQFNANQKQQENIKAKMM